MLNVAIIFISVSLPALLFILVRDQSGSKTAWNLFIFSFIWAFNQESAIRQSYVILTVQLPVVDSLLLSFLPAFGWITVFSASWLVFNKLFQDNLRAKRNLFIGVAALGVLSALLFRIVNTAAISFIDFSRWGSYNLPRKFFLAGEPTYLFNPGFYSSVYFFSSFFLINFSRFKRSEWKGIFFLIPFIPDMVIQYLGPGTPRFLERALVFFLLVILIIKGNLRFEYSLED